ncbi:MAG TPA: SRPBCC domain-containing protein [Actinomycetota bacterium]|nr:SRPBCC domain-containing protein [Actinomycetota bacterium]
MDKNGLALEPVIKRVQVGRSIDDAFFLFTRDMGSWWPLETHSIAVDTHERKVVAKGIIFDPNAGGHIYESMSDGTHATWGEVLVWEPPDRVAFTWKPNLSDGPHTKIEVRFTIVAGGTEVELEHRGWEHFGDDAAARRKDYDAGWPGVLKMFADAADHRRA